MCRISDGKEFHCFGAQQEKQRQPKVLNKNDPWKSQRKFFYSGFSYRCRRVLKNASMRPTCQPRPTNWKCACRGKHIFGATKPLSRQNYVSSDKVFFREKLTFVAANTCLSRQKMSFVATKYDCCDITVVATKIFCCILLSWQKTFCRYKNYTCGSSRQW